MQNKGREIRTLLTINGRITMGRRRWHGQVQGGITPMDKLVEVSEATISLGVRELGCRLNAQASSFDRAAENLYRAAQIRMSGELLRQMAEAEGKQVLALKQAEVLSPGWKASDCKTQEGKSRVYMGTDGVMVPMVAEEEKQKRRQEVRQKRQRRGRKAKPLPTPKPGADQSYKEFKLVTFYDQDMDHRLVSVTRSNHETAGKLMRRDARQLGLKDAEERIGNVDGAGWIRNQSGKLRPRLTALGLDFYHLSENVHKPRRVVFGDGDESGHKWAEELLHVVKHEGYEPFWERLVKWRVSLRSPTKRKAADQLMHYVAERKQMIQYPLFLTNGWQIGSGPTESMCKIVPRRVKGPGMRWNGDNAEAVMALEGIEQSHQWPEYWATCVHALN